LVPVLKRSQTKLAIETNKKLFLTLYHKCWRYWRAAIFCGGCLVRVGILKDLPALIGYWVAAESFSHASHVPGCYLRDFFVHRPRPLDMLKFQWEQILKHVANGTIDGYSILAAYLIDGQREEARWVRDCMRVN